MSSQGRGGKPEGKTTSHGGSHHKGGQPHASRGGGARADADEQRGYRQRQFNGQRLVKLRIGDKDKIIPAKESLRAMWAKAEFGELALILDVTPAAMPVTRVKTVPSELVESMKTKRRELTAVVEREAAFEEELSGEEGKTPSQAVTARIRELSKQLKELQSWKSDVEDDLRRANRMVDKFEEEALKLSLTREEKQHPKCIAMIGDIRNLCDPTLLQQLESHPAYSTAYATRDPAAMWNTLTAVVLAGLEHNPLKAFQDAQTHFTTLRQQESELLTDWKRRVEAGFADLGAKRRIYFESEEIEYQVGPLDDEKLAACHFIENLNRSFIELKTEISNDHSKGTPSMPKTLGEALTRAQTFKSPKVSGGTNLPVYAYATDSGSDKLRQGGNKKSKGGSAKHDHKKAQPDKDKAVEDKAADTKIKRECFLCSSTEHWAQACPLKDQAVKAVKGHTAPLKPRATALATHVAEDPDSDPENPWMVAATDGSAHDDIPELVTDDGDSNEETDESAPPSAAAMDTVCQLLEVVSTKLIAAASYKDDLTLGLDSQANVNMFGGPGAKELLRDFEPLPKPMSFNAASGLQAAMITHRGTFGGLKVYWGNNIKVNILANSSILNSGGTIEQLGGVGRDQYFEVVLPNGRTLEFTQSGRALYECKIARVPCVTVTTVNTRAKELGLTKKKLERTEAVRIYKARLGHMSTDQLIEGLNNGSIPGTELGITARDAKIFRALYGATLRYEFTRPKDACGTRNPSRPRPTW